MDSLDVILADYRKLEGDRQALEARKKRLKEAMGVCETCAFTAGMLVGFVVGMFLGAVMASSM